MFGFLRRSGMSEDERMDALAYLDQAKALHETLDREYASWLAEGSMDGKALTLERDPDGQHAAVYLYRVGSSAIEFVQEAPVKSALKYHEQYALCLEARAAAADAYKEAADYSTSRDPSRKLSEANRKLIEASVQHERAVKELADLEVRLRLRA